NFNNPAQAHFVAGNALLRVGKATAALEQYKAAARVNQDYPELHLNAGVAWLASGDTLRAEAQFRRELELNPASARAENNLGVILESRGDLGRARAHYLRACQANPDLADARINAGRVLLKSGDRLFQSGDLSEAEREYRKAAELLESDPRPLHRLALAAASRGDWRTAIGYLNEALELDAGYRPAREMLNRISNGGF
ncbi:MAG TPA: tetratricopeptide repeat protein, partial [Bacteroidetes bacterium]|nr:tetratricopeptide repeat protein [Bacteroidota bacterium]